MSSLEGLERIEMDEESYTAAQREPFTVAHLYNEIAGALLYGECSWGFNHDRVVEQIHADLSVEDIRALAEELGDTPTVRGFLGL